MGARGYVVRGKHRRGWPVFAYDHGGAFGGPSETDIPLHVFPSLDTASGARAHMVRCGCSDVAIFRVLDDGREERLPSYEEALAEIDRLREVLGCKAEEETHVVAERLLTEIERCVDALKGAVGPMPVDPLAALEAAERRLLEAGGWRPSGNADYSGYWHGQDGRMYKQAVAILAERRRLAAKGGA